MNPNLAHSSKPYIIRKNFVQESQHFLINKTPYYINIPGEITHFPRKPRNFFSRFLMRIMQVFQQNCRKKYQIDPEFIEFPKEFAHNTELNNSLYKSLEEIKEDDDFSPKSFQDKDFFEELNNFNEKNLKENENLKEIRDISSSEKKDRFDQKKIKEKFSEKDEKTEKIKENFEPDENPEDKKVEKSEKNNEICEITRKEDEKTEDFTKKKGKWVSKNDHLRLNQDIYNKNTVEICNYMQQPLNNPSEEFHEHFYGIKRKRKVFFIIKGLLIK